MRRGKPAAAKGVCAAVCVEPTRKRNQTAVRASRGGKMRVGKRTITTLKPRKPTTVDRGASSIRDAAKIVGALNGLPMRVTFDKLGGW